MVKKMAIFFREQFKFAVSTGGNRDGKVCNQNELSSHDLWAFWFIKGEVGVGCRVIKRFSSYLSKCIL